MFIGHYAIALGAKKAAPSLNLGLLFLACQLLDLIWPILVLVGIESVSVDHGATLVTPLNFEYYPYSHSLAMTLLYSLSLGLIVGKATSSKRDGIVISLVVFSHWILDFITHRPDLPISFDGTKVGLAMWNSVFLTTFVEVGMFAVGVWLYLKSVPASKGKKWFWTLIISLLIVYAGNIFGPKPDVNAPASMIAGPALALWILVFVAYRVDRVQVKSVS